MKTIRQIYIEVWTHPDGVNWLAEMQEANLPEQYPHFDAAWWSKSRWNYWQLIIGKTARVVVVSREAFTREECVRIAGLIVNGAGVKAWEINLN